MFKKLSISLLSMFCITFLATYVQVSIFKYTYSNIDFLPDKFQPFIDFILNNFQFIFSLLDLITILILVLFFLPFKERPLKKCNFKKIKLSTIPLFFVLALGLSSLSSEFLALVHYTVPNFDNYNAIPIISVWTVIAIVLVSPICEEIIFRGFLFSILKKKLPVNIALILQAICFGIFHRSLIQGFYAFIGGLFLGLIFYYTQNILSNILFHMLLNIVPFIINFISISIVTTIFLFIGPVIFLFLCKYYSNFKNFLLNS